MNDLLRIVIDAHGGADRWRRVAGLKAGFNIFAGLMIPTLRRVVRRTPEGPLLSGRTSFLLDYFEVEIIDA